MLEAISCSDWHLDGMNKHFKDATRRQFREIDKVYQYGIKKGINHMFIPGDISDTERMSFGTYIQLVLFLKKYDGLINTYYIGGNHDRSDVENTSCDLLKVLVDQGFFKTFRIFLHPDQDRIEGTLVNFCAWPHNESMTEKEGCLNFAHVTYNGAIGDNGRELRTKDEFRAHARDYTISGHIHQYQHIESRKVIFNGNPYQKNFGESLPKGMVHLRALTERNRVSVRHRFVDNQPGFILETVSINSPEDFQKLKQSDSIRYKLLVAPDVLVPTDLRITYPNITGGIFNAQTKKKNEIESFDYAPTITKVKPTTGLKDYLVSQGFSRKELLIAKSIVKEAMQELNLS
jgi:DNA repair exonuclease SbcCD nuclease subunit